MLEEGTDIRGAQGNLGKEARGIVSIMIMVTSHMNVYIFQNSSNCLL